MYEHLVYNSYEKLNKLRDDIKDRKEPELDYYIECMRKLRWTYEKTEKTEMLSHANKIVKPSYELLERYFIELAYQYLNEKDQIERSHMIEDISRATTRYWEALDTLIQCSNEADRQVHQSAPIDTGMRYYPPKLCIYYTNLLNNAAKLLQKEDEAYAFCVYPSLIDTTVAETLLSSREEHGKVVIISVPESCFARVMDCNAYLFHEFFHIAPPEFRLREERIYYYLRIILYEVYEILTEEIELTDSEEKILMPVLFDGIKDRVIEYYRNEKPDSRRYYSHEITSVVANAVKEGMLKLTVMRSTEMADPFILANQNLDTKARLELYEKVDEWNWNITRAAQDLLSGTQIDMLCDLYMYLFREGFADLMSVLMLRMTEQEFEKCFNGIFPKQANWQDRAIGSLRLFFMCETMTEGGDVQRDERTWETLNDVGLGKDYFSSWLEWPTVGTEEPGSLYSEFIPLHKAYPGKSTVTSGEELPNDSRISCLIRNDCTLELYMDYFSKCREEYLKFIVDHHEEARIYLGHFVLLNKVSNIEMLYRISTGAGLDDVK